MNTETKETEFRTPSPAEIAILRFLLSQPFEGRDALISQMESLTVKSIDSEGSLRLHTQSSVRANCNRRIPVEGRTQDLDYICINILLHVLDDKLWELEIYKGDSSRLLSDIDLQKIELIYLAG